MTGRTTAFSSASTITVAAPAGTPSILMPGTISAAASTATPVMTNRMNRPLTAGLRVWRTGASLSVFSRPPSMVVVCRWLSGFGVVALHVLQFIRRKLGKVADEMDEFPAVLVFCRVALAPGRHGGKADAVVNDEKQFAVGHGLRIGKAQVRRLGVDVLSDRGFAAAVVGVAGCAVIGEVPPGLNHEIWACGNRIGG